MSKKFLFFLIVCLILLISIAFCYGRYIEFSTQWPLYEALRTTASIIFAVVGAWLAIIYPDRLRFAFRTESKNTDNSAMNMGKLLSPAIHSTFILCIVLIVGVAAPIFKQFNFFLMHKEIFRGLSYALLVGLTFWQLITIILTLVPADTIKTQSDKEIQNKTYRDGLIRNMQTEKDV
ncbi:hypothetical protein [Oligella urethralis]|uniref:hypothetical protein n=1 Tax=Oligella urethralis TaxID=90245 RepID=UPI00288B032B|nr:hypothetical protein [Oligella urethralis]